MEKRHLADFPLQTFDTIRYSDTDRQGHVNNANFATFLESGRVAFIYHPEYPIVTENTSFVIASLKIDFLQEIKWPGRVDIGTGILKIGRSSIQVYQQLFQNDTCVATAHTTIVQVSDLDGKSVPLRAQAKATLSNWTLAPE